MADLKQYIVGSKNIPDWVNNNCNLGRIKFIFDEDNNSITGAVVHTPVKSERIGVGDAIIFSKSGISVKRGVGNELDRKVSNKVINATNNQKTKIYKPTKSEGIQQSMDE